MENVFFRISDFLRSAHGRVFGILLLLLMGAFFFKSYRERSNSGGDVENQTSQFWQNSSGELENAGEEITITKPFHEFKPRKQPEFVVIEKPKQASRLKPRSLEKFKPLPPLILSQATASKPAPIKAQKETAPQSSVEIENGWLLHCRLVSPIASNDQGLPVVAQLVKPLIQNGNTIARAGSEVYGAVGAYRDNRLYLAPDWLVAADNGNLISFNGNAQQRSYDAISRQYGLNDGQIGLPAPKAKKKKSLFREGLGTVITSTKRLAQDSVRTVIGDQVPFTTRNTVIEGTTALLEQGLNQQVTEVEPVILNPGVEFYIQTSVSRVSRNTTENSSNFDEIYRRVLQQRANRAVR